MSPDEGSTTHTFSSNTTIYYTKSATCFGYYKANSQPGDGCTLADTSSWYCM